MLIFKVGRTESVIGGKREKGTGERFKLQSNTMTDRPGKKFFDDTLRKDVIRLKDQKTRRKGKGNGVS